MRHNPSPKPARASELSETCHPVSTAEAEDIAARLYDLPGAATRFDTEKDDTFLIDGTARGKFVLKIAHPSEQMPDRKSTRLNSSH